MRRILKIRTQRSASIFIAVVPAVLSGVTVAFMPVNPLWTVVVGAVVFASTYAMAQDLIRTYIASRIRPIYQSFFSRNFTTTDLDKEGVVKFIEKEIDKRNDNKKQIMRLEANERYRKEYLGNVSHELKTPIFNIQGYISTLLDGALDDETVNRKYLERAEKNVDRMINIITDLEQISNFESETQKLHIEHFDIVAHVRELVDSLEMEAASRNISVTVDKMADRMMVAADKKNITQVLANLITNSIRYGNPGGRTEISFIDMFEKVMVEVADDGIGIPPEDQRRIFERFYRTDKGRSRAMGGTGLGLSIVKHIIEAHDETISVRSAPGSGSTFAFTLNKA